MAGEKKVAKLKKAYHKAKALLIELVEKKASKRKILKQAEVLQFLSDQHKKESKRLVKKKARKIERAIEQHAIETADAQRNELLIQKNRKPKSQADKPEQNENSQMFNVIRAVEKIGQMKAVEEIDLFIQGEKRVSVRAKAKSRKNTLAAPTA